MDKYKNYFKTTASTTPKAQVTNTFTKTKTMSTKFLSDNIIKMLNHRINSEELSSRIYLSMHLWLEDKGYFNAAKLWKKYSDEELKHADWSREHLLSFNIRPDTMPLSPVPNDFKGLGDIIRQTLEHETLVTQECQELALACQKENNVVTYTLAHKYCSEQVEEMQKAYDLINLLDVYGEDKLALALLDHELERFI